jgi:hypothetical protein
MSYWAEEFIGGACRVQAVLENIFTLAGRPEPIAFEAVAE